MESIKNEFAKLMYDNCKIKGLGDMASKLFSVLYSEPHEISMDDLAGMTGYSLSSVSTAMKFMENTGLVRRMKKPGSKKVYFYMEKNLIKSFIESMRNQSKRIMDQSRGRLTDMMSSYRRHKLAGSSEEFKVVETYYRQLLAHEKLMDKMAKMFESELAKAGAAGGSLY